MLAEQSTETSDSFETFEDLSENNDTFESFDDEVTDDSEPEQEKVKEDLKTLKDSKRDVDGKKIEEDKKPAKKDLVVKEEESEEEEEEEEKEESEEDEESEEEVKGEKKEDKAPKSKIRIRMGGELFNVDSDSTFKVKVDGKMEEVTAQDLINNYSGKTAWDKKFTEIGKEKKTLEFEKSQISAQKQKLTDHVTKALSPLKDPNGNPMDSLLYLVEMSGEDPYTAYRRVMESNLQELGTLLDMTETERELYFHKKKDELHGKVQKQRQAKMIEEQSFSQVLQKIEKLRQAHNVSEDQFVEASEELESIYKDAGLDVNSITEESVVDYASLRPHIASVKELIAPFEDNISEEKYGDVVAQLARNLRDGKTDKKGISEVLKRNFSVEEDVKDLNTKVYEKQKGKKPSKSVNNEDSNGLESFDDF